MKRRLITTYISSNFRVIFLPSWAKLQKYSMKRRQSPRTPGHIHCHICYCGRKEFGRERETSQSSGHQHKDLLRPRSPPVSASKEVIPRNPLRESVHGMQRHEIQAKCVHSKTRFTLHLLHPSPAHNEQQYDVVYSASHRQLLWLLQINSQWAQDQS